MRTICKSIIFLVLIFPLIACFDPSGLPIIKERLIEQEKQVTKQTDEMIEKSEVLQEIRKFCGEVPILNGFEFVNKKYALQKKQYLSFGYRSQADFETVKSYYKNILQQKGWKFLSEGGLSADGIEFKKDIYVISIYHAAIDDGANLVIYCEKLNN